MRRTSNFRPLKLVLPLPQATLDLSGYELDFWDPLNDPLRLVPLSRLQVRSLLWDPPCPPPPPLRPSVSLHHSLNSVRRDLYLS